MAVIIEGISVVINDKDLRGEDFKNWNEFLSIVPNDTVVSDSELVRVGFMHPNDVEAFIKVLEGRGIAHLQNGNSKDVVVVDQHHGFSTPCDWAEFGRIEVEKGKTVAACQYVGSNIKTLYTPDGWTYENSLSAQHRFIPTEKVSESMVYLRTEGNVDVYLDNDSGKEVHVGRTSK